MSAVHYRFKSSLETSTVMFDGSHISLGELKQAVMQQNHIKNEFDLAMQNLHTGEVYSNLDHLIPKNTSVTVKRVPAANPPPKHPKPAKGENSIGVSSPNNSSFSTIQTANSISDLDATEEEKVMTAIRQSGAGYNNWQGYQQTGKPNQSYLCYKCGTRGEHWNNQCPMNKQRSDVFRIKRSTGIPRSFMSAAESVDIKGVLMTPAGALMVPTMDAKAYAIGKKDKVPFSAEEMIVAETVQPRDVPPELMCPICRNLLRETVVIPCCGTSFCDECVRTILLENNYQSCPNPRCEAPGISPDNLIPNTQMRKAVKSFLNESGFASVKHSASPTATAKPNAVEVETSVPLTKMAEVVVPSNAKAVTKPAPIKAPIVIDDVHIDDPISEPPPVQKSVQKSAAIPSYLLPIGEEETFLPPSPCVTPTLDDVSQATSELPKKPSQPPKDRERSLTPVLDEGTPSKFLVGNKPTNHPPKQQHRRQAMGNQWRRSSQIQNNQPSNERFQMKQSYSNIPGAATPPRRGLVYVPPPHNISINNLIGNPVYLAPSKPLMQQPNILHQMLPSSVPPSLPSVNLTVPPPLTTSLPQTLPSADTAVRVPPPPVHDVEFAAPPPGFTKDSPPTTTQSVIAQVPPPGFSAPFTGPPPSFNHPPPMFHTPKTYMNALSHAESVEQFLKLNSKRRDKSSHSSSELSDDSDFSSSGSSPSISPSESENQESYKGQVSKTKRSHKKRKSHTLTPDAKLSPANWVPAQLHGHNPVVIQGTPMAAAAQSTFPLPSMQGYTEWWLSHLQHHGIPPQGMPAPSTAILPAAINTAQLMHVSNNQDQYFRGQEEYYNNLHGRYQSGVNYYGTRYDPYHRLRSDEREREREISARHDSFYMREKDLEHYYERERRDRRECEERRKYDERHYRKEHEQRYRRYERGRSYSGDEEYRRRRSRDARSERRHMNRTDRRKHEEDYANADRDSKREHKKRGSNDKRYESRNDNIDRLRPRDSDYKIDSRLLDGIGHNEYEQIKRSSGKFKENAADNNNKVKYESIVDEIVVVDSKSGSTVNVVGNSKHEGVAQFSPAQLSGNDKCPTPINGSRELNNAVVVKEVSVKNDQVTRENLVVHQDMHISTKTPVKRKSKKPLEVSELPIEPSESVTILKDNHYSPSDNTSESGGDSPETSFKRKIQSFDESPIEKTSAKLSGASPDLNRSKRRKNKAKPEYVSGEKRKIHSKSKGGMSIEILKLPPSKWDGQEEDQRQLMRYSDEESDEKPVTKKKKKKVKKVKVVEGGKRHKKKKDRKIKTEGGVVKHMKKKKKKQSSDVETVMKESKKKHKKSKKAS